METKVFPSNHLVISCHRKGQRIFHPWGVRRGTGVWWSLSQLCFLRYSCGWHWHSQRLCCLIAVVWHKTLHDNNRQHLWYDTKHSMTTTDRICGMTKHSMTTTDSICGMTQNTPWQQQTASVVWHKTLHDNKRQHLWYDTKHSMTTTDSICGMTQNTPWQQQTAWTYFMPSVVTSYLKFTTQQTMSSPDTCQHWHNWPMPCY